MSRATEWADHTLPGPPARLLPGFLRPMMRRTLNLVFLAGLIGALAVTGLGAHLVHGFQVKRNMGVVLDRARKTEAAGELDKTITYLRRYLIDRPDDGKTVAWLARVIDRKTPEGKGRLQIYEAFDHATRMNPDDAAIRRRTAALALEQERWKDAERHLKLLLTPPAGQPAPTDAEAAELEDQLGQCDQGQGEYRKARDWYQKAIDHDPSRIATSDRLARILHDKLKDPGQAGRVIAAMVAANPKSGRAYLDRWIYGLQYGLSPDDKDVA